MRPRCFFTLLFSFALAADAFPTPTTAPRPNAAVLLNNGKTRPIGYPQGSLRRLLTGSCPDGLQCMAQRPDWSSSSAPDDNDLPGFPDRNFPPSSSPFSSSSSPFAPSFSSSSPWLPLPLTDEQPLNEIQLTMWRHIRAMAEAVRRKTNNDPTTMKLFSASIAPWELSPDIPAHNFPAPSLEFNEALASQDTTPSVEVYTTYTQPQNGPERVFTRQAAMEMVSLLIHHPHVWEEEGMSIDRLLVFTLWFNEILHDGTGGRTGQEHQTLMMLEEWMVEEELLLALEYLYLTHDKLDIQFVAMTIQTTFILSFQSFRIRGRLQSSLAVSEIHRKSIYCFANFNVITKVNICNR
jgi:hypothetical protein